MIVPKAKSPFLSGMKRSFILKIVCVWFLFQLGWMNSGETSAEEKAVIQENPVSNEEFLRETIRTLLGRTFSDFPKAESKTLLLKAEEEHPGSWLLEDELLFYLLTSNYQVTLHSAQPTSDFSNSWSLFYRIIDMSLEYPEIKRKGFLGKRIVIRKASVNLSFRLEDDSTGKVLWTNRGKEERSDQIKKGTIKSINNRSYPLLSPTLPGDPQSRFIEPALVVAVVGGIIYLFFANR